MKYAVSLLYKQTFEMIPLPDPATFDGVQSKVSSYSCQWHSSKATWMLYRFSRRQ